MFDGNIMFDLFISLIVICTSLSVHECAHAWMAYKLGDPTARNQGRLTLNPLAHLDLIGTLSILLVGVGWAKPVPVNPMNFKNRKAGMAIVSLAGPVSNIILALITLIIAKLTSLAFWNSGVQVLFTLTTIFYLLTIRNISLGIFNLLPIPPLDGSRILGLIIPDRIYYQVMQYERYILIAVVLLLYIGILDGPLSFVASWVYRLLDALTFFIPSLL